MVTSLRQFLNDALGVHLRAVVDPGASHVYHYAEQIDDDLDMGHRCWVNVHYYHDRDPFVLQCWTFGGTVGDLIDEIDRGDSW